MKIQDDRTIQYVGNRILDNGIDNIPVSYTHLDVYKRQLTPRSSTKMKIGSRIILITAPITVVSILIFANPCVVMNGFIPVSYTHLDVYKRQD